MTRVALLQLDVGPHLSVADRIAQGLQHISNLKGLCDVAVLPELWSVGPFNVSDFDTRSGTLDAHLAETLSRAAREAAVWLHAGTFIEMGDEGPTNTALVFDVDGHKIADYRKIHLFGFDQGEAAFFTRGNAPVVIPTSPLGTVGLATCYDLRFPELFRKLVDAGAQTFVISSGWPQERINHWRVLVQARAIENQAWVIACNSAGHNETAELCGHSMVVDPLGNIVAESDERPATLIVDIDTTDVVSIRERFPVLKDRILD